jgi:hypothetical protein
MSDSPGDFTLGGVNLRGQTRLLRRFENATQALHDKLLGIIQSETDLIADLARVRMAELFKNPGVMQASVGTQVEDGGTFINGSVSAEGLPYLAIQEFGGVTSPHDIFPVNALALHFLTPGSAQFRPGAVSAINDVFAQVVHHPGSVIPERSYLRYALAQRRAAIIAAFTQAAADALDGE